MHCKHKPTAQLALTMKQQNFFNENGFLLQIVVYIWLT
jgi:hypothetical protein